MGEGERVWGGERGGRGKGEREETAKRSRHGGVGIWEYNGLISGYAEP